MRINFDYLPVGVYLCLSGYVYFDGCRRPIVRVGDGRPTRPCHPDEKIRHDGIEWFADDYFGVGLEKCILNHMKAIPDLAAEVQRRMTSGLN
jgi:hypothetical protein